MHAIAAIPKPKPNSVILFALITGAKTVATKPRGMSMSGRSQASNIVGVGMFGEISVYLSLIRHNDILEVINMGSVIILYAASLKTLKTWIYRNTP